MSYPVIIIFDIGKTNKKVLLLDRLYKTVWEETTRFDEITDEDGFPCEDIDAVTYWIKDRFTQLAAIKDLEIRAVNFSGYGASFVHLDDQLNRITPLYNYLKPYPEHLRHQFYDTYGGENVVARQTASPILGSLNSGMQLYRLKYEKPAVYEQISCSLHLPQYLSFILSRALATDISSVGCHTALWDFDKQDYHAWVYREGVNRKFAPLHNGDAITGTVAGGAIKTGIGLHDSSAALIPYIASFHEPFVLLSTGTWNISLNPFNHTPLTDAELQQDCLCYLSYQGKPVKASRLFAGYEHERQLEKLAAHFHKEPDCYLSVAYQPDWGSRFWREIMQQGTAATVTGHRFPERDPSEYESFEEAYHQLMVDIVHAQMRATGLILQDKASRIFVDGGFGKNNIFMHLLASAFPDNEVYAATLAQASATGAAVAIHDHWNELSLPSAMIELKSYGKQELNYSR